MSKEIKVTISNLLYLWYRKKAEAEDKTDSAMGRKCMKVYLSRCFGSETIKKPPED